MDLQNKEFIKSLLEVFDRVCSLCHTNYNLKSHTPMMLCLSQHICCQKCASKLIEKYPEGQLHCPFCHMKIKKKDIVKVRRFDAIIELLESYQANAHIKAEEQYQKFKEKLRQNIHYESNGRWLAELQQKEKQIASLYDFMLGQAKNFFREKKENRSMQILQEILLSYSDKDDNFLGLGSKDEAEGYNGDVYLWFARMDAKKAISALDLLGLCYLKQQNYLNQREFYTKLKNKNHGDYRVWYGLALVEHNNSNYKAAEELYLKVIQMKERFDKPYEMMAFIELQVNYKYENAAKMAAEALSRSPKNIFANYIIAMSLPAGRILQKLNYLEKAIKEDNFYLRAKFQIGLIRLQNLNRLIHAQICFAECLQADPKYHLARLHLAECLIINNKPKEAIQALTYFKEESSNISKDLYLSIGRVFAKAGERRNAIEWLQACEIDCFQQLGNLYFQQALYDKALQKYNLINKCFSKKEKQQILIKIGECYQKLKKYDKALEVYQEALLQSLHDQEILERIAHIITIKDSQGPRPQTSGGMMRSNTVGKKSETNPTSQRSYLNLSKKK